MLPSFFRNARLRQISVASFVLIAGLVQSRAPALAVELQMQPGDKVAVTVFNHPELSETATVDNANHVSLPLVGTIDASGASTKQLANRIKVRLYHYLPKVAVEVELVETQPIIHVIGGPVGSLPLHAGEHLSAAVAELEASGHQSSAQNNTENSSAAREQNLRYSRVDLTNVHVMRDNVLLGSYNAISMIEQGDPGVALQPGDSLILIDKPIKVSIHGDVAQPGPAYLAVDEPLGDAISQVGDPLQSASSLVQLVRGGQIQTLALGSPEFSAPAQAGDTIVVPRAPRIGVVGAVEKPGDVTLHGDASLISAIYNAGGPSHVANLKNVAVVHNGVRHEYNAIGALHGSDGSIPILSDGDTVFVPVGHKVDFSAFWQALGSIGSVIYAVK